ncbi:MAG TPA: ABC-type transport auxiliary lipoprotein family protein [Caulobacteraceae bacterium]|jgi:cholesterol transport system auxiliary component|nr:ABC-type transport auxiliary lipoprotein family protein [Caulobacteraceae bacterium]
MMRRATTLLATAGLTLGLAGCITLFPKTPPTPMYRFEATVPAMPASAAPFTVRASAIDFDSAASDDSIMTSNGDTVAYIGDARWVAPASDLFTAAVAHGFEAAGGSAHLVGPGAPGKDAFMLQMQVTRFEAVYESGPTAPPTVMVHLHARLLHEKDLSPAGDRDFDAAIPASDNKLSAIVPAYDQAVSKVVTGLVAWVNQGGG